MRGPSLISLRPLPYLQSRRWCAAGFISGLPQCAPDKMCSRRDTGAMRTMRVAGVMATAVAPIVREHAAREGNLTALSAGR